MNVRPPAWDKYEAVILLEGMIDIKQHDMPRNIVVERVSQDLRKMARNRGIEIDELFRNVALQTSARIPLTLIITRMFGMNLQLPSGLMCC